MPGSAAKTAAARRSLLKVRLDLETDFLQARQRAKQIAALLGFDLQDQTRIATAVSEIARNAWEYAGGGLVEFFLDPASALERLQPGPQLRIVVADRGPGIPHLDRIWSGDYQSQTGMGLGLLGSRRLLDHVEVTTGESGTHVTLIKLLPRHASSPSVSEIVAALIRDAPNERSGNSAATAALNSQNQELVLLLTDLRVRETELRALNVELEETNRGVLVLYAELADKAEAVQQASEMKTRFLSGVTHELRTPLNSIVSLARLMLGHIDGPLNAEQEKQLNFILRSAQNLTEMVNDLLDLAKIEAGKSSLNKTAFNVQTLFAGLRGMFRPLAVNPDVRLLFEMPETAIELFTDEGKLSQILRNFISNALKFTERGTITISAQPAHAQPSPFIRFSVQDTGVGIAPEHHDLVMQEWGQAPQTTSARSTGAKGSGLGLPLSRSLAELLGGSIAFTSAPGVGSTFELTLPALAPPPASPSADIALPKSAARHILIVDDDEVARYLLRRQLGTLTAAPVEEVADGPSALKAIDASLPRLVFLDLVMPGMSGHEVAKLLRAQTETASLPIALHTSKPLTPGERQAFESLDLILIPKRPSAPNSLAADSDDLSVELERALLETGLSNLHHESAR